MSTPRLPQGGVAAAVAIARPHARTGGKQHCLPAELRLDVAENAAPDEQEPAGQAHDGSAEKKADPLQRGVEVLHGSKDKVQKSSVAHQDAMTFLTAALRSLMLCPHEAARGLFLCPAHSLLLASRPPGAQISTVDLVPSRERVFMRSDSEQVVTSWLPLGLSYPSATAAPFSTGL